VYSAYRQATFWEIDLSDSLSPGTKSTKPPVQWASSLSTAVSGRGLLSKTNSLFGPGFSVGRGVLLNSQCLLGILRTGFTFQTNLLRLLNLSMYFQTVSTQLTIFF
jgi:hypothetical protein